MKNYSPSQINEIKQEIRTGKPVTIIADELAKKWNRPIGGVYTKVLRLSKVTRKITGEYTGPKRRPYKTRSRKAPRPAVVMNFEPLPGSLFDNMDKRIEEILADVKSTEAAQTVQEICEEIIDKPIQKVAEIGIEVPVGVMAFTGIPSRIVVYSDHVRYYFDN